MMNIFSKGAKSPTFISLVRAFAAVPTGAVLATIATIASFGQSVSPPSSAVGDGTLVPAPGSPYATGSGTFWVASGDFNGDGLADLVVATTEQKSMLTILLATRDGGFVPAPGSPITAGWYNIGLAVADFNGDGHLDIAAIGSSLDLTGVQVFLGDGHGGFSPMAPIQASSFGNNGLSGVGVGDFNRDGNMDLVVAGAESVGSNSTGYITILLGNGTGNFAPAPGSPTQIAQPPARVTVADFNSDGDLDIAVTNDLAKQVTVLLGDGRGGLLPDPDGPFPTGVSPIAIVHGDFNGDGSMDLAVANWSADTLTILLGDGRGGFVAQPAISVGPAWTPQALAVGDIDGDGILDLAIAVANGNVSNVCIFLGDGKGGFELPGYGLINDLAGPVGVTIADFNGDGRLDVATADSGAGTASVFLGEPASSSLELSVLPWSPANATVGAQQSLDAVSSVTGWDHATGTVTLLDGSSAVATGSMDYGSATLGVTFSTAGVHTLVASYPGDLRTTGSTSPPLAMNVGKGSQTISFPALANHAYGDAPFAVPSFSSSGLPVTLTVISGPATIAGNVLTLTGTGVVTLQASQPGNANWLAAPDVQQQFQVAAPLLRIDAVLNAASYAAGSFAPGSFAAMFGANLASLASNSGNLTTTLGGSSIQITDSTGKASDALLYFASPAQINFLLPSTLSPGMATMTVQTLTGPSATNPIVIATVSPGLFSADASGTGVAVGSALLVSADGTQTQLPISSCSGTPLVCTAIPIDLGSDSDTVYLVLYGTGIRGRTVLSAVTATIGGIAANVLYAGAQPQYPGLDQVNLQISPALRGRGSVQIALMVNGVAANVVTVAIQ